MTSVHPTSDTTTESRCTPGPQLPPDAAATEVRSIVPTSGLWWVVSRTHDDDGEHWYRREPVAAWGLLADGITVALIGGDAGMLEPAPVDTDRRSSWISHDSRLAELTDCRCLEELADGCPICDGTGWVPEGADRFARQCSRCRAIREDVEADGWCCRCGEYRT